MGSLKTARRSNEPFKRNLILAKIIFFLMILAKIKLRLNGSLDRRAVLSDPMASIQSIYINIFIFLYILFIKLLHISQNMRLKPSQHYLRSSATERLYDSFACGIEDSRP